MAISAETQCSRSRVAGPMSSSRPTGLAGPDADREQHDVAGGEAGHRERAQQGAAGGVLRGGERRGVERHQAVAERLDRADQAFGVRRRRRARPGAGGAWSC